MPTHIEKPAVIRAEGTKPKTIEEYIGRVNTNCEDISIARMVSPTGWGEPGQRPVFEEMTLVLKGTLRVEHSEGTRNVNAGEALITKPGEWVRYSTPTPEGAEYVSICLPAFSPELAHRDPEPKGLCGWPASHAVRQARPQS